jgi:hypothetical protein
MLTEIADHLRTLLPKGIDVRNGVGEDELAAVVFEFATRDGGRVTVTLSPTAARAWCALAAAQADLVAADRGEHAEPDLFAAVASP